MSEHVLRAGATAHGPWQVDITPTTAAWTYTGLKVVTLAPGETIHLDTGEFEYVVLPLSGSATVGVGDAVFTLAGRRCVWGEVSDYLFVPRSSSVSVTSEHGGRFALPHALATTDRRARYCPASEATVALRGAGVATRQVTNYALDNPLDTDRLLVCEVLTPSGNWSSYPPHKHDEESENEHALEEIYYFEVRPSPAGAGFAFHSTYGTPQRPIEVTERVFDGDTALVPHGWHGPCVAAPGHDLYYLNVMAGPGGPDWQSTDDPCFAWVRGSWDDQPTDPRLPMPVQEA